ncbi:MAG: hypothetical protein JWL89_635, partial [Candidatus Saccharibacteria bacterium]|nr:hypothetical protein [Candidatus Saccharibacteria bacterium]
FQDLQLVVHDYKSTDVADDPA